MKVDVEATSIAAGPAASGSWIRRARSSDASCTAPPATTNIAFGGDDWKTLYFTSRNHLGSVQLNIAGMPVSSPKRT